MNGLILADRFFIIPLHIISDRISPIAILSPNFLSFLNTGINKNAAHNKIQNIPAFPRQVIAYITGSVTGLCNDSNQCKI